MEHQHLIITHSLTDLQIDQLVQHAATDEALLKWTLDASRFHSQEAVKKWLLTHQNITVLTNGEGALLGLGWVQDTPFPVDVPSTLSPAQRAKFRSTSAVRLYGEARGKGLSSWFYSRVLHDFGDANIWDRVSADNVPSLRLHKKFGFQQVTEPDQENKVILVRQSTQNSIQ